MAPFIFYVELLFGLVIFIYFVVFDGYQTAEKFRDVCINDLECRKYLKPSHGLVDGWFVKLLNNADELLEKPTLDGRTANPWAPIRDLGRLCCYGGSFYWRHPLVRPRCIVCVLHRD